MAPPAQDPWGEVTVTVSGSASDATPVTLQHVSFGEVLLCSGQSNMVDSVAAASSGGINASDPRIQSKTWPTIRLFQVITTLAFPPWAVNDSHTHRDLPVYVNRSAPRCGWGSVKDQANHPNPSKTVCQTWQVAAPGVTDDFSAECFYAGMYLVESGAIPAGMNLGLVQSAYSGTSMEVWTPPEGFDGCPNKTKTSAEDALPFALLASASAGHFNPQVTQVHGTPTTGKWVLPSAPSCLWNTMVFPIAGVGLRAVLWNQGESNMGDTFDRFSCVFQNMIASWRKHWGIGDFPFLATQIGDQGGSWPAYVGAPRDAQLSILPGMGRTVNGGLVSAYDQGDHCGGGNCPDQTCVWRQHTGNTCSDGKCCTNPFGFFGVHSRFKQEIGRRMALVVRHACNLSASPVDWNGPSPTGATTADGGASIKVHWTTTAAPAGAAAGTGPVNVVAKPTRDCWECCDTTKAHDVFQVTTNFPQTDGQERGQVWTNVSWAYDAPSQIVTLAPLSPAPRGHPYVRVRYAASLWPQCAFYSSSNNVPAFSFSDLGIANATI